MANQQGQRKHPTGTRRDSALLSDAFVFTETTLIRTLAVDNNAERELFRAMTSAIPGVCPNQSGPVDRDLKTVACDAAYAPSARQLLAESPFVYRRASRLADVVVSPRAL